MSVNVKVLVLNWNGGEILIKCLESISKIEYDNLDIIVIDNASSDNSINSIHNQFPDIKVIALDYNYGYSKAYNKAFKLIGYSEDSFFMLLNNDTVVDKNIVSHFLDAQKLLNSKQCILGPKIYYMDNKKLIWYSGGEINLSSGIIRHIGIRQADNSVDLSLQATDYITGCCIFTHNTNIKDLNGFDEIFNMYCEDVDLSLRAAKSGIQCIYVPKAILWHKVSHSLNNEFSIKKILLKSSSLWKLYKKHLQSGIRYLGFLLLFFRGLISGIRLLFFKATNGFN